MQYSDLLIAAGISMFCIAFAQSFMRAYKEEAFGRAFWLKGAAALCFVALGALLGKAENPGYGKLLLIGLTLGLCGDELLALRFLVPKLHDLMFAAGAGAFAVGHFFYMKALYDLGSVRLVTLIPVFLIGLTIAYIYGKKHGSNAGPLQPAGLAYMALGGVCFGVSDNILFAYCFGKQPVWRMNVWVHITYYAAQLLIAWSIFFMNM